jgi:hypothetical protein
VDTPGFDEGALGNGHNVVHAGGEPRGEDLGNDFGKAVDEADGAEVNDLLRAFALRQQRNIGGIEPMEIFSSQIGEAVYGSHDVCLDDFPTA